MRWSVLLCSTSLVFGCGERAPRGSAEPAEAPVESADEPEGEEPPERAERSDNEASGGEDRAVGVAAGDGQACAWTASGRVFCWGRDRYGGVGVRGSSTCDRSPCAPGPVEVPVDEVIEVRATLEGTCARRRAGDVVCWGLMMGGEGPRATDLPGDAPLEARRRGICGRRSDGTEACVGGDLRPESDLSRGVALPAGLRELRGPGSHACVVEAGELRCWGSCNDGQCGPDVDGMVATPTRTAAVSDVGAVALGNDFTCALERAGSVVCFGDDRYGALGDGDPARADGPVRVRLPLDRAAPEPRIVQADSTAPILYLCDAMAEGHREMAAVMVAYRRGGAAVDRYTNEARGDPRLFVRDARAADPQRCAVLIEVLGAP
jgi:hypothetical protein